MLPCLRFYAVSLTRHIGMLQARLFVAIAVAAAGCADYSKAAESDAMALDHRGFDLQTLKGEVFSDDRILGKPTQMAVVGGYLWLADRADGPFVHALDTNTGTVARSFGRRGQGPEDFGIVLNIFRRPGDDSSLWVSDAEHGLRRMFVSTPSPAALRNPVPIAPAGRPGGFVHALGATTFVRYDFSDTATLVIFDSTGLVLRVAGVGLPGGDSVPRRERLKAVSGSPLCSMRDGAGLAIASESFGQIAFFDSTGAKLASARVPYPSELKFSEDPTTKKPRFTRYRRFYKWCTFSDSHLFALFSGKRESADPLDEGGRVEGQFVHVFDLKGLLIRTLDLGVGVAVIEVDRSGTRLYASSWTEGVVYRFTIRQ